MDLDNLRRLALGATPGPWKCKDAPGAEFDGIYRVLGNDNPLPHGVAWQADNRPTPAEARRFADAEFIAAANPQAIIELLDMVQVPPSLTDTDHYVTPEHGWTCFHCGEHFPGNMGGQRAAQLHFGDGPDREPVCKISAEDRGLVRRFRAMERELERYRDEDSDKDRQMAGMCADHARALQREEEKGYERGLRDGRNLQPLDAIAPGPHIAGTGKLSIG